MLRKQVNTRWPERDKRSDGWIGDSAHSSRTSDHNPDWSDEFSPGVVRAIDMDEDLLGPSFPDPDVGRRLADQLRGAGMTDGRIRYVIHEGLITSGLRAWRWKPYAGTNPHDHHIHVSFTRAGDRDGREFALPILRADPVPPPPPQAEAEALGEEAEETADRVERTRRRRGSTRRDQGR